MACSSLEMLKMAERLECVVLYPRRKTRACLVIVVLLFMAGIRPQRLAWSESKHPGDTWVATWIASSANLGSEAKHIQDRTLREIVHTSLGGKEVRVRISNTFGQIALHIGAVHVALRSHDAAIVPGTDHAVTFSGSNSISVPPGAPVLSDAVPFEVPAQADLAISIYLPGDPVETAIHPSAFQDSYVSGPGNHVTAVTLEDATATQSWAFLTEVDVHVKAGAAAIVALGDSITDGTQSTPNTNSRWPNLLAHRLYAKNSKSKISVVDAGIGGNRLLFDSGGAGPSALERFDRDALIQPGVTYVIVLEGINDIGAPGPYWPISESVTAKDLIAGYRQLIERAHERGVRIYGGTLTPLEGARPYYTALNEQKREAANQWIRTGNAFDGVIDFDCVLRDPQDTKRLLPRYGSSDHLHPSDAGYKAMADAIDLSLFQ